MSRNTHERGDSWHRGSLRATLVDVEGTDLEAWLRAVWDRIVALEVATPVGFPSFSLDAIVQRVMSGTAALDSILSMSIPGSMDLEAVLRSQKLDSFLLDAVLRLGGFSFTADAILKSEIFSTFALDSVRKAAISGDFGLDSTFLRSISGSFSADAVLQRGISSSATLDAVIRALSITFTLDAQIQRTVILRPSSDAASSGTINRSSGTANWSLIDETPNSNTDYVDVDSASGYFICGITSPGLSGNYIQKVVIDWRGTNGAPSSPFRTAIRDPSTGTVYNSQTVLGTTIAQGATSATHTYTTRPWDGSAWTASDVNSLQFGGMAASSGPYNNRTGSMWATIYYQ